MSAPPGSKVIRAPTLKRGKSDETRISERVKLERVLGLTVSSNAALDCDPDSEQIAYSAGCTVVLFNPRKGRQQHLLNGSRKTITSVAFSADGRYLATGECGHQPSVRVWDLHQPQPPVPPLPDTTPTTHLAAGVQVAEFAGHKYGINCVAFSPSHKYVVSVGSQHDMIVNVWDWRSNIKVASNKVSTKVKAVSFAENGSYFVTVGNRHVKFWYLEYSRSAKYKEPVPLMGRSAILGEQRNNYFCDVACGRGEMADSTYAITKSGLLCEFNNRRLLDKWVELRTTSANCMTVGENLIFIGCAEGIVRCFSPHTLRFVTTLPRTHYLGVDVAQGLSIAHMAAHPNNAKYPDAIALAYDEKNCKLTCVYNDHSLYVWDVHDIKRVGKSHSFLFHSACIWGVDVFPPLDQGGEIAATMPPGSFITCSSDDTIRVWNLDPNLPPDDTVYKRNIYSNELLKVLYVDPEMTYLKDLDLAAAGAERNDSSYDGRNGVRSIRISPDGKHLASGDRAGNIRIHRLQDLQELCRIEAHDAEVLCLEYSKPESGHRFLASASRDRLIHVFSVDNDYNFLQTLDDHSSSITAVRFLNIHDQLQMVSCGADKSIIFRQLQGTPGGTYQFSRGHNVAGKTTLYDMEVDSGQKHILTACQDRNIRVYNVNSGKHSKTFKGSVSEDGSLIKVVLDTSGIYAATSCTDKTLCVYDYYSGECMATMFGHSELVTGLRFTADCRRLISASGDGCIFVWRLPHDMVVTMHARLAQQAARAGRRPLKIPNGVHLDNDGYGSPPRDYYDPNANMDLPDYRFSVGQLPLWAKKQIADNDLTGTPVSNRQMDLPKGRWAQRLGDGGITVKSVYDSDSIIPIPLGQDVTDKRGDSDGGSKDSSIDSGTELRQYSDFKRETMIISKQITTSKVTVSRSSDGTELNRSRHLTDDSSIGSYKYEDMESTEHDGDVEDYSEGEGESTEPEQTQRLIYYPPAEETGSDYTVNAMDVEELRRSQRKHKRSQRPEHLAPLSVSASVSGSQDSDDDDEEGASTPGTENVDKNIASLLSASTESLDRVGRREKFLKNTFESLSGIEQDMERNGKDQGGTSISSQFLVRTNQTGLTPVLRNVAVINAAKQARTDSETIRKREELQRRIEETRRKLQNVGHRSNLKTSQSTTDLSHLPDKNFRPTGLAQRYTSAGGKRYATVIRHRMSITLQSETTKPLLSLPPQTLLTGPHSVLSKFYTQPNHPPTYPYPESPLASSATLCKYMPPSARSTDRSSVGETDLGKTQSYIPAKDSPQQTIVNGPTSAKSKRTNSNLMSNKSGIYHTLPIVKRTPKLLSLPMDRDSLEIDTPPCGTVTTPPKSPGILKHVNTPASSGDDKSGISDTIISTASCSIKLTTNNAVDATATVSTANTAATTPTNTTAAITATTKIFNAVRNNSSNATNDTKSQTKTKPPCSPSKRPVFLNLTSNINSGKLRQGRAVKTTSVNYSLPESPVCDDLSSPTALFQNLTDSESAARHSKLLQTRRSCSYFIDLNTLSDKDQEFKKDAKVVAAKSSESLPATIGQTNASSSENLLDSCDEEDDAAGNFSSDSLEEPSEFSSRTPRRCVSDYQIFTKPHRQYMERRLSSVADRHKGLTSCSQESILSDTSGQLSSSGDILEMCEEEQDRHSSASFFLSLRHGTSQESILGEDCSQPRYRRDSCRSTEGILETGDFHHRELQARHRDSCQSTESVLTDDSDLQRGESCGFVNKGFDIAAGVYSRQCRGSIPPNLEHQENPTDTVEENRHRTIFRTRSLQDTRSKTLVVETTGLTVYSKPPIAPSSRPQTPSKRLMKGENLMSQFSEPAKPPIPTYRKNSYPRSRPQTPTSITIQPQIKMTIEGADLNGTPLSPSYMNTRTSDSCQESPCNSLSEESKPKSSYRPPTAPKPVGKIAHKPPPKPRQKPPPHSVLRDNVTKLDIGKNSDGDNGISVTKETNNEKKSLNTMNNAENERQLSDGENTIKNLSDTANLIKRLSGQLKETMRNKAGKQIETKEETGGVDAGCIKIRSSQRPDVIPSVGVKLLRKSFENVVEDAEVSDLEEDSFPMVGGGSGSSTPATSSSAANSPKRAWPPASRAPVQRHHLAKQLLPSKYSAVSGKANKPASGTRTLPRHSSKQASSSNSNIMRSTSMGMLNQSDSESDLSLQRSSMAARLNGLMRPTISSQNKVNTLGVKNTSNNSQSHRRGMRPSFSSVNLSQVGNNEDSSSEETSSARGKSSGSSRPRSTSTDRLTNGAPNSLPISPDGQLMPPPRRPIGGTSSRQRSAVGGGSSAGGRGSKPVPAVRQHQLDPSPQELPVKDTDGQSPFMDVASAPLSQQLCSSVAEQLTRTADSVVQLYKRLAVEGDDNATSATAMLQALEEAVAETQRTLRLVTEPAPSPDQTSPLSQSASPSGPDSQEQKKVMVMMQQYSDMLLSMVHQRMNSAAQQKPS